MTPSQRIRAAALGLNPTRVGHLMFLDDSEAFTLFFEFVTGHAAGWFDADDETRRMFLLFVAEALESWPTGHY